MRRFRAETVVGQIPGACVTLRVCSRSQPVDRDDALDLGDYLRIGLDTARSRSCYREKSSRIPVERASISHITRDATLAVQ